jgi:uncharacterized protein YndB with AHSA1/START domain
MSHEFTVSGRIARPVAEVFEAVVDPKTLSGYFTTGGAQGRLEAGAAVTWDFHDFLGAFPVEVIEVVQNEKIVLRWGLGARRDLQDDGHHDLRRHRRRAHPRQDLRGGPERNPRGGEGRVRQLRGLDRHALRSEGLHRARPESERGLL